MKLAVELLANPFGVASAIDHSPDDDLIFLKGVMHPVGKNPAQQAVVVLICLTVDSSSGFQALDVAVDRGPEIFAKT